MGVCDALNEKQREAVLCTEGPELILAGAGSGKTRVITHRIAYLIAEKGVDPWNIMAITFTNKAAEEMRTRVDALVQNGAERVWVATFHSTCVRMLRRFIDRIGYDRHFTIYDTDDSRTLMKQVIKDLGLDPKSFRERTMLSIVSSAKNELKDPEAFAKDASGFLEQKAADCYRRYQADLQKNNALDFDDLLMMTVRLFETCPDVLDIYRRRFRYLMVDEYQDTNTAQFRLIELLAGKDGNLCVVGDDDQSIYRFRGANIYNILNFEKAFPGAHVVKLEENYRSKANILNAANEVIRHNLGRKEKKLWTRQDAGEKVHVVRFESAEEEADRVAEEIGRRGSDGHYSRFAVLYRTNAQSRLLEERFVTLGIPYQLIGGVNFYQRREIKDILAYLKTVANGRDDLACLRILNVPKRGIGDATVQKVQIFAEANALSFYDALREAPGAGVLGRAGGKIKGFTDLIESLRAKSSTLSVADLIRAVLEESGYTDDLQQNEDKVEAESRQQNIDELINKAVSFEKEHEEGEEEALPGQEVTALEGFSALDRFLEEVSLVADIDRLDTNTEKVTLMTLHAAKGLEFDEVYMTGMEDGLFPGIRSLDDPKELEEERRLCYVGITRAKERLTMTGAQRRMMNGDIHFSKESMFLREIPDELKTTRDLTSGRRRTSWHFGSDSDGAGEGLPWETESAYSGSGSPAADGFYANPGSGYGAGSGHGAGWSAGGSGSDRIAGGGSFRRIAGGGGSRRHLAPPKPAAFGKEFKVVKADHLDYGPGDRVRHQRFGEGTVLKIEDGARDFEVTVDFGEHGIKKMFAGFAKLEKIP